MAKQFKIPQFNYSGIKRITIPKLDSDFRTDDFGWSIIKKYLSNILSAHKDNAEKINFLYNYFLGMQDILAKERLHKVNKDNNNREIENHANRQVEFKVGFICGEQRDYTHKLDTESDDLIYLDRYFTDCNFFSKDSEVKEWVYATGIGTTHTAPRIDIIVSDGIDELTKQEKIRYATIKEGYNIEYEAPFTYDCVDPKENFVVYSSARNKQPLFCVSYVDVDLNTENDTSPNIGKELLIETRYASFRFKADSTFANFYWSENDDVEIKPKNLHYLPLIEFSANKDRLGLVEKNRSSFNTINLFRSNVNDMLVDDANAVLVFKNVDITGDQVAEMKKAGAIIISDKTGNQGGNAELKTITIEIPFDKLSTYLDQVIQNAYDIAGVPLASGQVTSGGDTGQARLLGGGWNNAYTIAHKEIQTFLGYDYEQLKLILMLCKQVPNCPLDELYASQVDINYRINQNDNFLVKTQGMKNLFDMHCDLEFIMKVGGLSNDIKTDSKAWQKSIDAYNKLQEQLEDTTETIDVKENTETIAKNNDTNSQE